MLPGVMIEFLNRATVAVGGTRDRRLVPHVHGLSGWRIEDDRQTLVFLASARLSEGLLSDLEDNGRFAMTAEVIGPHETYQFKGRYLDSRPATEADHDLWRDCRERFVTSVRRAYGNQFAEDDLRARIPSPDLVVRIHVEEVFVQTPGPGAGQRLFPLET